MKIPIHELVPYAIATGLILIAFTFAVEVTSDLDWPPRTDFYREMGSTQSILEKEARADPAYLGETRWYTPLVPRIVSVVADGSNAPVQVVFARAGPYLNLLGPIAFFLFVRMLFNPWLAVVSLAVYLYVLGPLVPPGTLGTYSPWFWTRNFAQGLFFVTALIMIGSFRSKSFWWEIAAGLALGVTFLAHPAPAMILALYFLMATMWYVVGAPESIALGCVNLFRKLAVTGLVSLLVCLPFLLSLLRAYGFETQNRGPSLHVAIYAKEILAGTLSLRTLLGVVGGLILLLKIGRLDLTAFQRDNLVLIMGSVVLLLGYGIAVQRLQAFDVQLVQIVPAFHFHLYFKAIEPVFTAIGLLAVSGWLFTQITKRLPSALEWLSRRGILVGVTSILVILNLDTYLGSHNLNVYREESLAIAEGRIPELHAWVLDNTDIHDVFLADDRTGLLAIASAARKVVVLNVNYSNPYVDYEQRREDRDLMYEYLREHREEPFRDLAANYSVDYVIGSQSKEACCTLTTRPAFVEKVFEMPNVVVFRVHKVARKPTRA